MHVVKKSIVFVISIKTKIIWNIFDWFILKEWFPTSSILRTLLPSIHWKNVSPFLCALQINYTIFGMATFLMIIIIIKYK